MVSGSVAACWRYPVKSLQGVSVDELDVRRDGVAGDRAWALVDATDDRILSAKRWSALLMAASDDSVITLPDGARVELGSDGADDTLSAWLGRPVHLASRSEAGARTYQMTFDPPNDDAEYVDIPAPPGSFVDAAHVHVVSTATLDGCERARPDLDWDARRFRPNLVLDVDGPPFAEQEWVGRYLQVGEAVLHVSAPMLRCAMPLRAQPGLERQAGLFQAMVEVNEAFPNHLGLSCSVRRSGRVRVGDPIAVSAERPPSG